MGGFGGYNEKKKKKQKQGKVSSNTSASFGSKPEYTMPEVIKPVRKDK